MGTISTMSRSSAPLRSSSSPPSGRAGTLNGATCSPHGGEGWCKRAQTRGVGSVRHGAGPGDVEVCVVDLHARLHLLDVPARTLGPIRCTLCVKDSLDPGGSQRTKSRLSPEPCLLSQPPGGT